MAKYRLRIDHELETTDGQRLWLPGDTTNEPLNREGTIVGDGTPYKVGWPTLHMIPLDDEAKTIIALEEKRLLDDGGAIDPVNTLPIHADDFEERYIPGMDGMQRRPPLPDGASVRTGKVPVLTPTDAAPPPPPVQLVAPKAPLPPLPRAPR
jgi:hypothetical protein